MSNATESAVLNMLSAIEIDPEGAARVIKDLGNEGVTVLSDIALGTFPGLRAKVRANAIAILGWVDHPQAREAVQLLVHDPNPDFSIRALRAAARRKDSGVVTELGALLQQNFLPPLVAAEVVSALQAIDSPEGRKLLDSYESADPTWLPHRGAQVVEQTLREKQK